MRKFLVLIATLALFISSSANVSALELPKSFTKYAYSPALANSGIIVLDPDSQEPIFADNPDSLRAPASVLKLLSTTTAIKALGADTIFKTSVYKMGGNTFALVGQADPWLTTSKLEATKYHRAFLPYLIYRILKTNPKLRSINLKSKGVYLTDIANVKRFYRHRLVIHTSSLNPSEMENVVSYEKVGEIQSPPLAEIIKFTLLWSDNILADRLARTAARKMGFTGDEFGIQSAFEETLTSLGVPTAGLEVYDGNGLSHENRVSPRTIATLLLKIKDNPEFKPIVYGLPTAGETGTLKDRFIKDAPSAVGLVKAKTGWINNSVSLAGYVDVGNHKYVFAVIADHVKPYEKYRAATRRAIDKMLGTIASPPSNN